MAGFFSFNIFSSSRVWKSKVNPSILRMVTYVWIFFRHQVRCDISIIIWITIRHVNAIEYKRVCRYVLRTDNRPIIRSYPLLIHLYDDFFFLKFFLRSLKFKKKNASKALKKKNLAKCRSKWSKRYFISTQLYGIVFFFSFRSKNFSRMF